MTACLDKCGLELTIKINPTSLDLLLVWYLVTQRKKTTNRTLPHLLNSAVVA